MGVAVIVLLLLLLAGSCYLAGQLDGRARQARRRGGYMTPPASSVTNRRAGGIYVMPRTRVGFSSYDPPGNQSAGEARPAMQPLPNNSPAHMFFGGVTAGGVATGRTLPEPADSGNAS